MSDILIDVEHVSKKYCRFLKESMYYGVEDVGRNLLGLSSRSDVLRKHEFWSVDDVSFQVKRGETLGLVGVNGSGKTTMLKMLNGLFWPDKGKITVRGRVGALIAVGAGFHPLLTGRENIYINGAILGMTKKEVDRKFDDIVEFSGIANFLDTPIKHYSSGMFVRLGFAIAVHSDVDILLIDEVLAVGDIKFQGKCMDKIKELGRRGVTKIFVAHSFEAVKMVCTKTLYLHNGKVRFYGDTDMVLDKFKQDLALGNVAGGTPMRYGTKEIEIRKVELLDSDEMPRRSFSYGQRVRISISFYSKNPIENPSFSVTIFQEDGQPIYRNVTKERGFNTGEIYGEGKIVYTIESLSFRPGKYWLSVGCWNHDGYVAYDHHEKIYPIHVETGMDIPDEWEIKALENFRL